jgi:hypothetical protein
VSQGPEPGPEPGGGHVVESLKREATTTDSVPPGGGLRWAQPGMMLLAGVLVLVTPARADEGARSARRVVEQPEVRVCYRERPWPARRVGQSDPPGLGSWAAATMDVRKPLAIGGIELDPGCYAWVCTHDEDGQPVLELRRLRLPVGTLHDPKNVHPLRGRGLFRMPLRFDTSRGTTPHLTLELSPGRDGLRLKARYGDGEAQTTLRRR